MNLDQEDLIWDVITIYEDYLDFKNTTADNLGELVLEIERFILNLFSKKEVVPSESAPSQKLLIVHAFHRKI